MVLLGLMGSGKTTIGAQLAGRLGRPFRDSDAEIQAREGLTVRELRERIGVEAMHALESSHLFDCLADEEPSVIAAAASVVDVQECLTALRAPGVLVVWLRAKAETLAGRFNLQIHRPSYGADTAAFLASQARHRDPLFAALGAVTVDTDVMAPDQAVDWIVSALAARPSR